MKSALVEQTDLLPAAFDGQPGGTAAYARRHGTRVARIVPVKAALNSA